MPFIFSSEDLVSFSAIKLDSGESAVDITEYSGEIYLLATRKTDKEYLNAIFKYSESNGFYVTHSFRNVTEAGAFCRDGGFFYVSLGRRESLDENSSAGQVVRIAANTN